MFRVLCVFLVLATNSEKLKEIINERGFIGTKKEMNEKNNFHIGKSKNRKLK